VHEIKTGTSKGQFEVRICAFGKKYFGGLFLTSVDAAKRYNELALQHHGEFARLNKIDSKAEEESINFKSILRPRKISIGNSGYRGVTFNKKTKKYGVRIFIDGKNKHIGEYATSIEAAVAYNKAATSSGRKNILLNKIT